VGQVVDFATEIVPFVGIVRGMWRRASSPDELQPGDAGVVQRHGLFLESELNIDLFWYIRRMARGGGSDDKYRTA
jgi:hypothetical protein